VFRFGFGGHRVVVAGIEIGGVEAAAGGLQPRGADLHRILRRPREIVGFGEISAEELRRMVGGAIFGQQQIVHLGVLCIGGGRGEGR